MHAGTRSGSCCSSAWRRRLRAFSLIPSQTLAGLPKTRRPHCMGIATSGGPDNLSVSQVSAHVLPQTNEEPVGRGTILRLSSSAASSSHQQQQPTASRELAAADGGRSLRLCDPASLVSTLFTGFCPGCDAYRAEWMSASEPAVHHLQVWARVLAISAVSAVSGAVGFPADRFRHRHAGLVRCQ